MRTIETIEIAQATAPLAEYARRATAETIVVTANGLPLVALVALDNVDMETVTLSTDPRFMALIERSRSRLQKEGGISSAEMRRRLGLTRPGQGVS
jgi:antitoxin (DNA-binding transcriptional repressor) of toxin-antitoxin stability system